MLLEVCIETFIMNCEFSKKIIISEKPPRGDTFQQPPPAYDVTNILWCTLFSFSGSPIASRLDSVHMSLSILHFFDWGAYFVCTTVLVRLWNDYKADSGLAVQRNCSSCCGECGYASWCAKRHQSSTKAASSAGLSTTSFFSLSSLMCPCKFILSISILIGPFVVFLSALPLLLHLQQLFYLFLSVSLSPVYRMIIKFVISISLSVSLYI